MNIKVLIYKLLGKGHLVDPKAYIKYLRSKGVQVGDNLILSGTGGGRTWPKIDVTRPSLVTIGDNVFLNRGFTLLTHDYVTKVFKEKYHEFLPSSGAVKIGNNVSFGYDCMVLKGVTIGDNCFIAAGSVVTKDIPANSLAAGRPAKVVCTIDEYYERRKTECIPEALAYARSIKERYNRDPRPEDFWEEFPLFVDAENIDQYPMIPIKRQMGTHYDEWLKNHKRTFNDFDEFITKAFEKPDN